MSMIMNYVVYDGVLLVQVCKFGILMLFEVFGLFISVVDFVIYMVWFGVLVVGLVYLLECLLGDNFFIYIVMEWVLCGSVLVILIGGFVVGYWGEVFMVVVEVVGVVGLVIDGGVCDIVVMMVCCFLVFMWGICMCGIIKVSVLLVGQLISFVGMFVVVGDLVVVDDDGVFVIFVVQV